ncbi:MAG: hypothetical protein FWC64_13020 [Treponema sp.]|nr:hypothetical protein [Treponema sp.]
MLKKRVATVIFLFLVINFLPTQEIDRTLYLRTTLLEIHSTPTSGFVEYYNVDARFVRSFTGWGGERWEFASPDGRLTGVYMQFVSGLLPPEEGQVVTIFFRWVPEQGDVVDYWVEAVFIPVAMPVASEAPAASGPSVLWYMAGGGAIALLLVGFVVFLARRKR